MAKNTVGLYLSVTIEKRNQPKYVFTPMLTYSKSDTS